MAVPSIDARASTIDERPVGALQRLVLALCALCMVIDGFDVQTMSYAAAALVKDWHVARSALGAAFGAGLLGMFAGSLALGSLADVVGRRPVLIAAMAWVAVCMGATPLASSLGELTAIRFVAGIGMGAVVPNAIALAGEYSPARIRVTLLMAVSSGYIVGGVVGGAVSAWVIPPFGWRGVFYAGALLTGAVTIAMLFSLPESLQFSVLRRPGSRHTHDLLRRLGLDQTGAASTSRPSTRLQNLPRRPWAALFGEGRIASTLLLWFAYFANMLCAYFLATWIPVLMSGTGFSTGNAVLAGTALWLGGLAGNLVLGVLIDRRGFGPVMFCNFVAGGAAIAGISYFHEATPASILAVAIAGFCVLGGQSGLNALAAALYPTHARGTGTGWASGVGRLGAVLGPVTGGYLVALGGNTQQTLLAAAVPTILAAASTGALGLLQGRCAKLMPAARDPELAGEGCAACHADRHA
ncbi:MFS transporter [Trinickia mobilis]|uniref:MFS transporter n=1 Tax=Trinickia mobilis TaxID=2816356 RepID=UPI001A8EDEC3|nr:MFS transporter [Trinickia mobilis]